MSRPSTADGVAAALLFARGRPEGLALLPPTPEVVRHSFRAALICLPAFLGLRLLAWADAGGPGAGYAAALLAEAAGFTVAWAGFALLSRSLAAQAGLSANWPRFIAAWNWSNLVQFVALVAMALPGLLGAPAWVGNGLTLAALGYALWLEWFVTRAALGVPGAMAAMFVLADVLVGLFAGSLASAVAR